MDFFRHLFTPTQTNNYRAKIVSTGFLVTFIISFFVLSFGVYVGRQSHPEVLGISYSVTENELLADTNRERQSHGMKPLVLNQQLSDAARQKASYMFEKNFWAHFAPDGTTPWSFIKKSGYEYVFAGENLAKGFYSSQEVVDAWMNSPSHRENLLSSKYKDIGFAVQEGSLTGEDTVLVVQMFGSPSVVSDAVIPETPQTQEISSERIPEAAPLQQVSAAHSNISPSFINTPSVTKSLSIVFLIFIITVLILDLVIVEKKKIPRVMGHNLDHIILLVLFFVFILLERSGGIL